MKIRSILRVAFTGCLLTSLLSANPAAAHHNPINVTFVNPGFADESFWRDVDNYMQAAADQLNVRLTIVHGNRNPEKIIELGETLGRAQKPEDYVFLVNEKNTGARLLELIHQKHPNVLFILNALDAQSQTLASATHPKGIYGSLVPDNRWAGYQVAQDLYQKTVEKAASKSKKQRWVVISGDQYTPASRYREQGVLDFIKQRPDIELVQQVYADWMEEPAYEKTRLLLERHQQFDVIWTANDHMAFGAIKALEAFGLIPGTDTLVGTFNSSQQVLRLLADKRISSLSAGHFMAGGWALVLAYDHFHHRQFDSQSLSERGRFFELIKPDSETARILYDQQWHKIPFAQFSRTLNPDWQRYSYELSTP